MDACTTLILFHEGKLSQLKTINLLALVLQKRDELDLRYGLEDLDSMPSSRDIRMIRIILRKLGIIPRRLAKLDEEAAKIQKERNSKMDTPITEQALSKFLNKEASQRETLSILIGATQDSAVKSRIKEADKSGNLDENTRFLFKRLGVLPIIA
jgi:hypothetical protein